MKIDLKNPVLTTQKLIQIESVTPNSQQVLNLLREMLEDIGFECEIVVFQDKNTPDIANLYARIGQGSPHLMFAGHVDVVPIGDETDWKYPPFSGHIEGETLYGRGAVDMKGGVGAFVSAVARFLDQVTDYGSISFLITGDEEGPAINGSKKLLEWATQKGEKWDHCLLGEPTNSKEIGDVIKVGRRGSLSGEMTIIGQQGHVAYPDLALNPIPLLAQIISALDENEIDQGNDVFQPSNLEIINIEIGNQASNIIPRRVKARFNIRYNDLQSEESLKRYIETHIHSGLPETADYILEFEPSNSPVFRTESGEILKALEKAIVDITGNQPALTTGGGTSDGRFIKDYCPIIEFGLVGESMHKVDEHTSTKDLEMLTQIYLNCLNNYFIRSE